MVSQPQSARRTRAVLVALLASTATACGTPQVLEPREPPARTVPRVHAPAEPPAAGYGRLVIEAVDGPMDVAARNVEMFQGAASKPVRSGPLCRTPCVVDLPLGRYTLYFSGLASDAGRGDVADVEVRPGLNVLRRAPGKYETPEYLPPLPVTLVVGGALGMVGGAALIASDTTAGGVVMGGGIALGIGGVIVWPRRATQQDGASTYWNEPPAARPAPAALPAPEQAQPVGEPEPAPAPSTPAPSGAADQPPASAGAARPPETAP